MDLKKLGNNNRQSFELSSINRKDKWTIKELQILVRENLTDYEKVKKLPQRTDGSVRIKRRRMGYKSRKVIFHRQFKTLGYVLVRKNGSYQRRCRLVLEESLGRKLLPTEIVHHINGNKEDDRPENLYLYDSIKQHTQVHYQTMEVIKCLMEKNIVQFKKGKYYVQPGLQGAVCV